MNLERSLLQSARLDCSSPTSSRMAVGLDCQLGSLHRSELVYRCDVFSHSAAAGSSLPFQAYSPYSFTKKPAVWLPKNSVPSFSQRDSHPCLTKPRAQISVEKSVDLPTIQRRLEPTPPVTMEDLTRPTAYWPECEFENVEQSKFPITEAQWLDSFPSSQNDGQLQAFTIPESDLFYQRELLNSEQPTIQGQILSQPPNSLWNLQASDINRGQLNLPPSVGTSEEQGLLDSSVIPPLSNPSLEPYIFPLTPPSSTRDEGASPTDEAGASHQQVTDIGPQIGFDGSTSHSRGLPITNTDLSIPLTPQYLCPEIAWSNEDFVKLFEAEPFLPNLDSFEYGSAEQSMLNNGWESRARVPSQDVGQSCKKSQPGGWPSPASHQLLYSNAYPAIPSNAFDQASTFTNSTAPMPNYHFDVPDQPPQPEASSIMSSLFDGLSPDVDHPITRRRVGVKAPLRATAKDRELIEWKSQGLSYKEIKARGAFDEAESTLRGRYRTLTKPKHLRVRKPEWQQKDVRIVYH
jgi:hypothetical protein